MDLILARGLDVGDPMPTEAELTEELGVGRNTVREALKVLQALGVVEVRHGFGTFVAGGGFGSLLSSLAFRGQLSLRHGGAEALELVDVRQALEAGLVGSAIQAMTAEDFTALDRIVVQMETKAEAGLPFTDEDRAFHQRLYRPLNSELLSNLLDVFWVVYRRIHEAVGEGQEDLVLSARQHREILNSVFAKDTATAVDRMNRHFDGIRKRLNPEGEGA